MRFSRAIIARRPIDRVAESPSEGATPRTRRRLQVAPRCGCCKTARQRQNSIAELRTVGAAGSGRSVPFSESAFGRPRLSAARCLAGRSRAAPRRRCDSLWRLSVPVHGPAIGRPAIALPPMRNRRAVRIGLGLTADRTTDRASRRRCARPAQSGSPSGLRQRPA